MIYVLFLDENLYLGLYKKFILPFALNFEIDRPFSLDLEASSILACPKNSPFSFFDSLLFFLLDQT